MIAIKGMEMPNSCGECRLTFRKTRKFACSINLKDIHFTETERPKDCPLIELVTCKNCKHRPVDDSGSIEPPYDVENRRLDETCPCINKADWRYSYVPEDEFFCAYAEEKSVTPVHKKSKWIFTKTKLNKHGSTVECPSCHKKWTTYDEIRFEKENKYCPNCGEEMENKE